MDWSRIRRAFHIGSFRPDPEREVDDEIRFHFERTVEELIEGGMSPDEARREAERRFGDVAAYRADLEERERARIPGPLTRWAVAVSEALTFAFRRIRRSPGFSVAVVATLTLGIGANVAMFRIVDRLMLSPPEHVVEADRVRQIYFDRMFFGSRSTTAAVTYPDFMDMSGVSGFEDVAAYTTNQGVLKGNGSTEPAEIRTMSASGNFFSMLGVRPQRGRFFDDDDDRMDAPGTAVLSHDFWERRFGSDPGVLGREMDIDNGHYTVVGIAPEGFTGTEFEPVDVWLPLLPWALSIDDEAQWRESRTFWWLSLVGRLASGVSAEAAEEEATVAYREAGGGTVTGMPGGSEPDDGLNTVFTTSLLAADRPTAGDDIPVARWLAGVAAVVLIIACANVANLFLARNLRRRRELAVRAALGVGRRRLMGQLLAETGALALLGGAGALLLVLAMGEAAARLLLPDLALTAGILDSRVLLFAAAAVAATVLLSGVIPAVQAGRANLSDTLKSGSDRGATARTRTQTALLVVQAALSVVLLAGATLFVRSLNNVQGIDLGFESEGLITVGLDLNAVPEEDELGRAFSEGEPTWPPNERTRIYEEARERALALPTVESASLMYPGLFGATVFYGFSVPGLDSLEIARTQGPFPYSVDHEFFATVGLEIVRGRGFEPADDAPGAPAVMVVNESLARAIWPEEDPIGRCARIGNIGNREATCATVVGIVEDAHRTRLIEEETQLLYYVPLRQQLLRFLEPALILRAGSGGVGRAGIGGETGGLGPLWSDGGVDRADLETLRSTLQSVSPRIRFARVQRFTDMVEPQLRTWRLGAAAFSAFGLLALVVAAVGLYSVLSFDVAGRAREMGIRSALGAHSGALLRLVARQVAVLMSVGVAIGLAGVAVGGRWIEPLLYEVSATDPSILAGVGGVLLAVAAVATAVPAIRATRVDPVEVMRAE